MLKGLRHYNIEAKPLSEAFDAYDKQHSVRKTKSWPKHLRPIVLDFISWIKEKHPRITVNKIDGNDVLAWQDVLIARGNDGATVQKKINTLDSFFRWCQSRKWLPDGENSRPTSGMSRKAVSEPWKSYEEPEIRQMFKPDVYLEHNRRLPHKYWLPLLGLYGGARLNEFCRLRACDFREIEGVKVIDYTHASTKNLNSKRIVPVHPGLLDLGLLDYVEAVKKQCGEMATIFPYLADPQKAGGGRFAHYADKTGITDERQVYHSFRHTIAKKMASAGFPPHYAEYYTGHLSHKIHYTVYAGQDKPQKHFAELLAKVSMPVDISALRLPAEHWQQCLKTEIEKFQRRTSTDARKRRLLAHQRGLQKQKKQ
jgi:integrase